MNTRATGLTGMRGGYLGPHPFGMFLSLAFGIPILLMGSLLVTPQFWAWVHGEPFDSFAELERLTRALGLGQVPDSSIHLWLRLSLAELSFWTGFVFVSAPATAACIVVAATGAHGELRDVVRCLRFSQGLSAVQTLPRYTTTFAVVLVIDLCLPLRFEVPLISFESYLPPTIALILLSGTFFAHMLGCLSFWLCGLVEIF